MTTNTNAKNTFKIGQKFNKTYPVAAAIWCKANNANIKPVNGAYTIVENDPAKEPTLEEKVQELESKYKMNRWQREGILAEGSAYSDYTKEKAQEIETLAEQLRVEDNGTGVL